MTPSRAAQLFPLALLVACALVYLPGLSGGFIFDDFSNILTNTRIQAQSLTWDSLKAAALAYEPGGYGRPLATLGFALDYWLGGKDPWGYKVHSLLVHLVNTLLVFALVRRILALPRSGDAWPAWSAFAIALLWAVHPLQVSSVLYVVQRMETLSVTFVLLALLAYLRGRIAQRDGLSGWRWLVGSGLLAGLGMLSKESAILFPVFAFALELTLLDFQASQARTRRFLIGCYGAGAVAGLLAYVLVVLPEYLAPGAYSSRDFTVYERLLTQLRVLPMYLGQMLLPLPGRMLFYYDNFPKSTGWLSPASTLAGGVFLLSLLVMAWQLRRRLPLAALGIFWFFAAHLLTSNVIRLEHAFEHRNYFALLGVLLALAALVRKLPVREENSAAALAIGSLVVGVALLGAIRAATWGQPLMLASYLAEKNPGSPRASSDLATLYVGMAAGQPDSPYFSRGMQEFDRGSRLPNSSPLPEQGLIISAASTGQPVPDEWWASLVRKLETRPMGVQESLAVNGLLRQRNQGLAMDDRRLAQAYTILARRSSQPPWQYATMGDHAINVLGDETLATELFLRAIDACRSDPGYARRIIEILVQEGHVAIAQAALERADKMGITLPTDNAPAP